MKNLKHIESDEDKIKMLETNVDNLNMRLKKANDIGYVSGLIIVFLLICCFVLGIYSSKSDAKNRVLNSINDKNVMVAKKAIIVLDEYNKVKNLLDKTTLFTGLSEKEKQQYTDSVKLARRKK